MRHYICTMKNINFKYGRELILFSIIFFQILSLATLMHYPSEFWGDEGTITNAFENYNQNGEYDLTFYKYAPLQGHYHMGRFYLFSLSLVNSLLDDPMFTGRFLSFVSGLGVLLIFYTICKKVINDQLISLALVLSLSTSGFYLFNSHFTRFEMFALFWFLLSVAFLVNAYETNKKKYLILSGTCVAVILEVHIVISIGMIISILLSYLLIFNHNPKEKLINTIICFILPAMAILSIWILSRYFSNPSFLNEILYLKDIVVSSGTYSQQLLISIIGTSGGGYMRILNLLDMIFIGFILCASIFLIRIKDNKLSLIIAINFIFIFMFLIIGRLNSHYYFYFLPLGLVAAGVFLKTVNKSKLTRIFQIVFICFIILNCVKFMAFNSYALSQDSDFYNYGNQLKSKIPVDSTVLVYHNLAPFFGFQFASTRDLEFALDIDGMTFKNYIEEYRIEYFIHDYYFDKYLLNSGKINITDFNSYRHSNLKLVAEIHDQKFGVYNSSNKMQTTKIYEVI